MTCSWISYSWKRGKRKEWGVKRSKISTFSFYCLEERRYVKRGKEFWTFSLFYCTKDHTFDSEMRQPSSLWSEGEKDFETSFFIVSFFPAGLHSGEERVKTLLLCTPSFQKSHDDEKKWRESSVKKKGLIFTFGEHQTSDIIGTRYSLSSIINHFHLRCFTFSSLLWSFRIHMLSAFLFREFMHTNSAIIAPLFVPVASCLVSS